MESPERVQAFSFRACVCVDATTLYAYIILKESTTYAVFPLAESLKARGVIRRREEG